MIEPTYVEVGGLMIQEPMTLFTDLLMGGQCLLYAWWLRQDKQGNWVTFWFQLFFLLMGIGSVEGGLVNHGFFYLFGPGWKTPMVILVGLSMSFLSMASVQSLENWFSAKTFRLLGGLIALQYLLFLASLTQWEFELIDFKAMIPHLGVGILIWVVALQVWGLRKDRLSARQLFLWSMASMAPAMIASATQYSPHKWFNNFDLFHVLFMPALYMVYRAAKAFKGSKSGKKEERVEH